MDPEIVMQAARDAAKRAYAPYSDFHVGAAILTGGSTIHQGANVENASYPEGHCAETSAIGAMVASGGGRLEEVVVSSPQAVAPCGGCRQRLSEFGGPDTVVHLASVRGVETTTTLGELLPLGFGAKDLG